ncbi:DUF2304 domain-containing protein [Fannyhessea vaginae]|uniref:DUF2304 domain-containing protein n=1 Tax=Fannyhessea vaginae TaxID=82135 RepID=UPI00288C00FA|nr:DUF2304 domain-containing protein [Fannyhessea vaginae]
MSIILRILLIMGAVGLMTVVLRSIKKSRIQIEDSLFWVSFVGIVVIIALVPAVMIFFARILGFVSTSNFVFLCVVGILLIKVFTSSVEISRLKFRVNQLAQEMALAQKKRREDNEKKLPFEEIVEPFKNTRI